jgi:very-short-patch-repair endonuclease
MSRPSPFKTDLARNFRKEATESEKAVWKMVRDRQLLGLKFRRQHVIDGFIVDFYCPEHMLVLEIDGLIHDDPTQKARDEARSVHFRGKGLKVARIRNEDVSRGVLIEVLEATLGPGRLWPED